MDRAKAVDQVEHHLRVKATSKDPSRLKEFHIPTLCPMALLGTFCLTSELLLQVALAVPPPRDK